MPLLNARFANVAYIGTTRTQSDLRAYNKGSMTCGTLGSACGHASFDVAVAMATPEHVAACRCRGNRRKYKLTERLRAVDRARRQKRESRFGPDLYCLKFSAIQQATLNFRDVADHVTEAVHFPTVFPIVFPSGKTPLPAKSNSSDKEKTQVIRLNCLLQYSSRLGATSAAAI